MNCDKDLNKLISKLSSVNRQLASGELKILSFVEGSCSLLYVQDIYGILVLHKSKMQHNYKPTLTSALNKLEYFENQLYNKNEFYRKGLFSIIDIIDKKALVKDEFGICFIDRSDLLRNSCPAIRSAINKNDYFKNKLLKHNKYFRKEEFTIVSDYIGTLYGKMTIHSEIIGNIQVRADVLLRGYKPIKFNPQIIFNANKYKKQLYVIHFYNEDENFYKIGISDNTEGRLKYYPSEYQKEIIYLLKDVPNAHDTFYYDMEQKILKEFTIKFKYKPKIAFSGSTECLTENPLNYIYSE